LALHVGLHAEDVALLFPDWAQHTLPSGQFTALPHCNVTTVVSVPLVLLPMPPPLPLAPVLLPAPPLLPLPGVPSAAGEGQVAPTTHEYEGPLPMSITQQLSAGIMHVAEPHGRLEVVPPGCA
jgi:hypothetical protein